MHIDCSLHKFQFCLFDFRLLSGHNLIVEKLTCWDFCLVDPTKIPSINITPLGFDFVMSSPHKSCIHMSIESVKCASSNLPNFCASKEKWITWAFSVLDAWRISHWWVSKWTQYSCCSVKIDNFSFHVRYWTINPFTVILRVGIGCVKSSKPMCADISG